MRKVIEFFLTRNSFKEASIKEFFNSLSLAKDLSLVFILILKKLSITLVFSYFHFYLEYPLSEKLAYYFNFS